MDVQMRNALADGVVHGDEAPLRSHGLGHRCRQPADPLEQRTDHLDRKIGERLDMRAGHQQHVSGEERSGVEESERDIVVPYDVRRRNAVDDLAEDAGHVPHGDRSP